MTRSEEYLRNAYVSLEQNEVEKASEFLWGTMAEAVKGVAALKEIRLHSHRQLQNYARELSRDLEDQELMDTFHHAESLHGNFYESDLTVERVLSFVERIESSVGRLLALIPPEVLEQ